MKSNVFIAKNWIKLYIQGLANYSLYSKSHEFRF